MIMRLMEQICGGCKIEFTFNDSYLIMKAGAGGGTVHSAVTGQEGAAPAETEAMSGVVAEELVRVRPHQGHSSAPVRLDTGHMLQVSNNAPPL